MGGAAAHRVLRRDGAGLVVGAVARQPDPGDHEPGLGTQRLAQQTDFLPRRHDAAQARVQRRACQALRLEAEVRDPPP